MEQLEELKKLIDFIKNEYHQRYIEWKSSAEYYKMNQKNTLVKDIQTDDRILNAILNYRAFINSNHLEIQLSLKELRLSSEIDSRAKAQNSIESKIKSYMTEKHNYGEGPLNKCFNDLYGIRIVFNNNISYSEINDFINKYYPNDRKIRCIDSSKDNYVATHIYFKEDNFGFQWELQVWDKKHQQSNILSHERHKQGYTKWEMENKGGESF